jgi:Flp pilus assembly CpaF family ATPase
MIYLDLSHQLDQDPDRQYIQSYLSQLTHFDFIKNWLLDETVDEILFHGPKHIQLDQNSKLMPTSLEWEKIDWENWLNFLTLTHGQKWDFSDPFVSFGVPWQGFHLRLSLLHKSATKNLEHKLNIRKIRPPQKLQFQHHSAIAEIITQKLNTIICGATGSGKTTFLNHLLTQVPAHEHLLTIEDSDELFAPSAYCAQLISSSLSHGDHQNKKTMKDFCQYALRLRPDRIVLGEIRSSEITPFLLAMNTGHRGLVATIHADSAVNALKRMALLYCLWSGMEHLSYAMVMNLICQNVERVIFMKEKKIVSIIKVLGSEGDTPFYQELYSLP